MLKNKKAIYFLIPFNIGIWGFLAYRIVSSYTDASVSSVVQKTEMKRYPDIKDTVTYQLSLDYKDPFLKDAEAENHRTLGSVDHRKPPKLAPLSSPVIIPKQLPDIKYLGLIKNNTSGITTALITLNGQSHLIKPNEKVDGIIFKSFNRDSLIAKSGKDRIVVRK